MLTLMYKLMSKGTQYQKSSDWVQMKVKGLLGKRSPSEKNLLLRDIFPIIGYVDKN